MSRHEDEVRLGDMLSHSREAIDITSDLSLDEFKADRIRQLAVVRLLQIIGEAANQMSAERQARIAGVPWRQIVGLRNRVTHAYGDVDLDIVWTIVQNDLPPLIRVLEEHFAD